MKDLSLLAVSLLLFASTGAYAQDRALQIRKSGAAVADYNVATIDNIAFDANAQDRSMYIYKKSAVVNTYKVAEIDSITFVNYSTTAETSVEINGVVWATRNVDMPGAFAPTPESAGMFYQWNRKTGWSHTKPPENSNGATTWDNTTPSGSTWESANEPCPDGWRLPTETEQRSLLTANRVWTTQNGVVGMLFGTAPNTVFFPASGIYIVGNLYNVGTSGNYWSNTQEEDNSNAYSLSLSNNDYASIYITHFTYGLSVRCVEDLVRVTFNTAEATKISKTQATLNGNITKAGDPAYTERGFCYATSPSPTAADHKIVVTGNGTGAYSYNLTGLTSGTLYYVRAYVVQDGNTIYGNEVSFTTTTVLAQIVTYQISNISTTGATTGEATLNGLIFQSGNPAYTERGFCYATSSNPTIDDHQSVVTGSGDGAYACDITGLMSDTKYYVRAYVIQNRDTIYGNEDSFTTPSDMIHVKGGIGWTGINISSFYIAKYEVTQKLWMDVMGSYPGTAPSSAYGVGDNYPMYDVSWNDIVGTTGAYYTEKGVSYYADGFCYKLYQLTGKKYRLPTEAEWEYAANGGQFDYDFLYSGSEDIDEVAWYSGNSGQKTHPVGTKARNLIMTDSGNVPESSAFDMSGNVSEWCSDWYGATFPGSTNNPT
ncbi:MAG: SUMF1/EgtB/PvdO family nonheme iron enzyme [Candidatus Symbiothrix sp.]|jgi:uncharacterized protein (TIGR02145 family)|nr:SUMF1/EgtB/PvdO family nonheme iron enzyme [Candidatus Symbiothrix sp.]